MKKLSIVTLSLLLFAVLGYAVLGGQDLAAPGPVYIVVEARLIQDLEVDVTALLPFCSPVGGVHHTLTEDGLGNPADLYLQALTCP